MAKKKEVTQVTPDIDIDFDFSSITPTEVTEDDLLGDLQIVDPEEEEEKPIQVLPPTDIITLAEKNEIIEDLNQIKIAIENLNTSLSSLDSDYLRIIGELSVLKDTVKQVPAAGGSHIVINKELSDFIFKILDEKITKSIPFDVIASKLIPALEKRFPDERIDRHTFRTLLASKGMLDEFENVIPREVL